MGATPLVSKTWADEFSPTQLLNVDWKSNCIFTCVQCAHKANLTTSGGGLSNHPQSQSSHSVFLYTYTPVWSSTIRLQCNYTKCRLVCKEFVFTARHGHIGKIVCHYISFKEQLNQLPCFCHAVQLKTILIMHPSPNLIWLSRGIQNATDILLCVQSNRT